jgi:hypothetical protein
MSRNRGVGSGLSRAAPSWTAGTLLAAPDRTSTWSPARLAREAFALTFRGSREDLAEVSARRTRAALLFLVIAGRGVILAQAVIDVAVGSGAYTHPFAAIGLAVACVAESVVWALVQLRAQRLTAGALLADAVFGVAGLAVMSAATTAAPGRAGSLNWMLPYTVLTAVGFALLAVGDLRSAAGAADPAARPERRYGLVLAFRGAVVLVLAVAYLVSVSVPRRLDPPVQLGTNDANFAWFFGAALVVSVLLRRWLTLIGTRNAEAMRQAAELSHEAHWRALTVDVFGPVLELLDGLEALGDAVPAEFRREADRLICLIEAVKPRSPHALPTGTGAGVGMQAGRG